MTATPPIPTLLPDDWDRAPDGPVECLGMTFENDAARRAYFLERLREKLRDPEFRAIEGFPIGEDEDILRLSDPPHYTACPNPFIADFIRCYGKPYDPALPYRREPLAVDVSEGKTDLIYTAHSYHTKVPHRAIIPAILHYTEPGDVVLDGFAGSGMTGVAAQLCGNPGDDLRRLVDARLEAQYGSVPTWGIRRAVLSDLDPAATAIAATYNLPFDTRQFAREACRILDEVDQEIAWMYETIHSGGNVKGRINYTVWSQVFSCPVCSGEVVFLNEALDAASKRVRDEFACPHCGTVLTKDKLQRMMETLIDPEIGTSWSRVRLVPVLVNYSVGNQRYEKAPDDFDRGVLRRIAEMPLPSSVPANAFPIDQMYHGSRLAPKGFTCAHHLYLPRAAQALGLLWSKASAVEDDRLRHVLLFFVDQAVWGMSLMNRYKPIQYGRPGGSQVGLQLNGVYYVGSQISEVSPDYNFRLKIDRLVKAFDQRYSRDGATIVATVSAENLGLPLNPWITCSPTRHLVRTSSTLT